MYMNEQVSALFGELADLPPAAREGIFAARNVAPELRAEVESLLAMDSGQDHFVTNCIGQAAEAVVQSNEGQLRVHSLAGQSVGCYTLVCPIGHGGMGTVWLARRSDGRFEGRAAVKFLNAALAGRSGVERFRREGSILARLAHPNIARLLDVGETAGGRPYLILEYIDGVPIDVYSSDLELSRKLHLFLAVCDAVAYAHRNLIIHRDIKPSNILVDTDGKPKLLDFGIGRILAVTTDQTRTGERLLTPDYASPEQVRGDARSTATDVYSLGAVLYRLLTGQSPHAFPDCPAEAIAAAICTAAPAAARIVNPDLPADLDFILLKALRKEPEERYTTVEQFADDLKAFLESRPVRARSANFWYRSRKFARRYWMPVSAAAVVTLSLAAGLYIANHQRAIAEARVAQLRELSRQQLEFEAQLSTQDGGTNLRLHNKIAASSVRVLESLHLETLPDEQLALQIGAGYLRIARLQGVPEWNQMGQYTEAEKSLSKAGEVASAVLAANPTNREALWQVANVAHDRAVVAWARHRPEEVIAWSARVVEPFNRLAKLGNLTRREINGATYIYGDLAEANTGLHRFEDAVRYSRLGIDYSQDNSTVPGPRAQAFNMLAGALMGMGDLQGAQEAVRQARLHWEQLRRDEGDTKYTRLILYQTRCREGLLLGGDNGVNLNRPQEAILPFEEAFDALEIYAQTAPTDYESRTTIATAGHYLGDLLRRTNPRHALEVYDHSLAMIKEVPDDVAARRLEALLLAGSSYSARWMHREDDASQRIEASLQLLRETGDYPGAALRPESEADIAVRALADHDAETGRLDDAIRTYRELRAGLLASNPDPQRDLVNAISLTALDASLAALLRRTGAADEAAALEAGNRDIWHYWDGQLPNNPFVQREITAAAAPRAQNAVPKPRRN
jgi:serine/threonine-protein kinase